MSLEEQIKNLSHHSLQAYILKAIQSQQIFNFFPLISHPKISTVERQCFNLLSLFVSKTYNQINEDIQLKLTVKQKKKLKQLSILSFLQKKTEANLSELQKILSIDKNQLIDLLIQLNIQKILVIKIDEKKDKIQIFYSLVRGKEYNMQETHILQAKIEHIVDNNKSILSQISKCLRKKSKSNQKLFDFD